MLKHSCCCCCVVVASYAPLPFGCLTVTLIAAVFVTVKFYNLVVLLYLLFRQILLTVRYCIELNPMCFIALFIASAASYWSNRLYSLEIFKMFLQNTNKVKSVLRTIKKFMLKQKETWSYYAFTNFVQVAFILERKRIEANTLFGMDFNISSLFSFISRKLQKREKKFVL